MDKREAIVFTAAGLIHQHGYNKVGIKSILDELSIPKGSFYHYFKSKEDLGLAIIDVYINDTKGCIQSVTQDLEGLKSFYDVFFDRLRALSLQRGCPVGNLILELSDENELFRGKLFEWYDMLVQWTATILEASGHESSLNKAKALTAAFEGTMMLSKLDKDSVHFDIFYDITLKAILEM